MIPANITKYLSSRFACGPWTIDGIDRQTFDGVVVIPALAESETLFATLCSLAKNPPDFIARFLVLVVVNNRQDASLGDKQDNRETLRLLAEGSKTPSCLSLGWIDASSPGRELPPKKGGVGLARKIGFDLALPLLDYSASSPILVALDADTLVQPDYLPALASHFRSASAGGAVLAFRHQQGNSPLENKAICRYELFLRAYVLGLSLAGSPYAFHTVGSAMACTAAAYAAMGGMNSRQAAEDFYFLQQLKKTSDVAQVTGTIVHPSARSSHRVPFGTGKSISRLLADGDGAVLFHGPECFAILRKWLSLVAARLDHSGAEIRLSAGGLSPALGEYLDQAGFVEAWEKLQKNNRGQASRLAAFHAWFDGLRTLKLIHHLSDTVFRRKGPAESVQPLLQWANIEPAATPDRQLALLRSLQIPDAG